MKLRRTVPKLEAAGKKPAAQSAAGVSPEAVEAAVARALAKGASDKARELQPIISRSKRVLSKVAGELRGWAEELETAPEAAAPRTNRKPTEASRILRALIANPGKAVRREELAALAEASPTSSSFVNNLGALRSLGLIDYPQQGMVRAEDVLFLERRN